MHFGAIWRLDTLTRSIGTALSEEEYVQLINENKHSYYVHSSVVGNEDTKDAQVDGPQPTREVSTEAAPTSTETAPTSTTWANAIDLCSSPDEEVLVEEDEDNPQAFLIKCSQAPKSPPKLAWFPDDVALGLDSDSRPEERAAKRRGVFMGEHSDGPQEHRRSPPRRHMHNWSWDKPKASSLVEYHEDEAPDTLFNPRHSEKKEVWNCTYTINVVCHISEVRTFNGFRR